MGFGSGTTAGCLLGLCREGAATDGWRGQNFTKGWKDKRTRDSYRVPSGWSFLEPTTHCTGSLYFGKRVTKGAGCADGFPSLGCLGHARTRTHIRLFPISSTSNSQQWAESVESGMGWAGLVSGGARGKRGEEACIARECTGVISGLWCSQAAAGPMRPLPRFCVLILSSFLSAAFFFRSRFCHLLFPHIYSTTSMLQIEVFFHFEEKKLFLLDGWAGWRGGGSKAEHQGAKGCWFRTGREEGCYFVSR